MTQIELYNNLTRVPQTLTFDFSALDRTFGLDVGAIVADLILFVSRRKFGTNLFGEVEFTLDEFCTEFGYNRTTLQRTVKDLNLENVIKDGHCYDSLFEFAIYKAMKETVFFNKKVGGERITHAVLIFNYVRVDYVKNGNQRNKRTYVLKFSAEMQAILLRSYHLADHADYKALRHKKIERTGTYRKFYLQLVKYMNQIKYNDKNNLPLEYVVSVDELAEIFLVEASTPVLKKRAVKIHLTNICKLIEHSKFSWEFVKNGTKQAYFVRFSFPPESLSYFDERQKASFLKQLLASVQFEYSQIFGAKLQGRELSDEDFAKAVDWYFSRAKGKEGYDRFLSIYRNVYGTSYKGEFGKLVIYDEK